MYGTVLEDYLFRAVALLLAITVHEFAHGLIAVRLGDPTPKVMGRLTLNPLAHLDPIGAIMLLAFKFGWAKPVPINPRFFKNPRKGVFLTGLAGPTSNVIAACLCAWLLRRSISILAVSRVSFALQLLLFTCIQYNLMLASFNLIPVPPLDGSKIFWGLLPPRYDRYLYELEKYGYVILLLLVLTGFARYLISPVYRIFAIPVDMILSY